LVQPSPKRVFKFRDAVVTDVGKKRNENQDAFSIAHTEKVSLYIVADGMGGARGGATASSLAVNIITGEAFSKNGELTLDTLKTAIEKSNRVIHAKSIEDRELSGMGTTLIALAIRGTKAIVAHVGDSRIYRIRDKKIELLTKDHTLVQELVDSGAIKEGEADSHPIAHMLTRSLGPIDTVDVEIREIEGSIDEKDRFLLCSDGLYNLVSNEEILEKVNKLSPQEATDELLKMALERGGSDNITIEIVETLLSDHPFKVSYPSGTTVDVTVSGEVEVENVDALIAEVSKDSTKPKETSSAKHEDIELDELFTEDRLDEQGEFVFEDEGSEFKKIRAGLMLMVGVMLSTLAYSFVKYGSVKELRLASKGETAQGLAESKMLEGEVEVKEVIKDTVNKELVQSIPTESKENETVEIKVEKPLNTEPVPSPELIAKQEEVKKTNILISKVARIASDKRVGKPPVVIASKNTADKSEADRPIIWENEQSKLKTLQENGFKDTQEKVPVATVSVENTYSKDGKKPLQIVKDKINLREKIKDLDAKLSFLKFKDEQSSSKVKNSLSQQLDDTNKALSALVEKQESTFADIKDLKRTGKKVKIVKAKVDGRVLSTAKVEQRLANARKNYELSQQRWREDPRDLALASQMSAYSRELDAAKRESTAKVESSHSESISDLRERYAIQGVTIEDLERMQGTISRHIGYLEAHTEIAEDRVANLRDQYLGERATAVAELEQIKAFLGDDKENGIRERKLILESTER